MVVSEIKAAVFDTINVVLPAFVKLILFLCLIYYITNGKIIDISNMDFNYKYLEDLDASYKSAIASTFPVLFITFLLTISYFINKFIDTIGSLIPMQFYFESAGILARNTDNLKVLWSYMPDAKNVHHLDDKVHRLYIELEARNESYVQGDVQWAVNRATKARSLLYLTYALLVITVISFCFAKFLFNSPVSGLRTSMLCVFMFISILLLILRYVSQERKVFETRFFHVVRYVKTIKSFDYNYSDYDKELVDKMAGAKNFAPVWCKIKFPIGEFPIGVLIDFIKEEVDGK